MDPVVTVYVVFPYGDQTPSLFLSLQDAATQLGEVGDCIVTSCDGVEAPKDVTPEAAGLWLETRQGGHCHFIPTAVVRRFPLGAILSSVRYAAEAGPTKLPDPITEGWDMDPREKAEGETRAAALYEGLKSRQSDPDIWEGLRASQQCGRALRVAQDSPGLYEQKLGRIKRSIEVRLPAPIHEVKVDMVIGVDPAKPGADRNVAPVPFGVDAAIDRAFGDGDEVRPTLGQVILASQAAQRAHAAKEEQAAHAAPGPISAAAEFGFAWMLDQCMAHGKTMRRVTMPHLEYEFDAGEDDHMIWEYNRETDDLLVHTFTLAQILAADWEETPEGQFLHIYRKKQAAGYTGTFVQFLIAHNEDPDGQDLVNVLGDPLAGIGGVA
ncbi:MAG: hypothetical protein JKY94_17690 [Rhodobacteraceae bacterium]|nr:hypothetical protein [Paracoccaceae bacterium]